ncbi:MAG: PAS domain S-box protein, partial [Candidatus Krumholzibacteria bacterium]|nr:PAS domain S-box protein [Candidatus Krumholzibacteria bacterium]
MRKLTYLRLMAATLVVGAAIIVLQLGGDGGRTGILYGLLAAIYLSTALAYLAFRAGAPFGVIAWSEAVLDCAVITLILHFSGGSDSHFAVLYVLPILLGAAYFQVAGGLTTAGIATASYVVYSMLEAGGYVFPARYGGASAAENLSQALLRCYLFMAVFVLTGLFSGHMSAYVRKRGDELASKERELERVRLHADSIIMNVSSGLIVTGALGEIATCNPAARDILGLALEGDFTGRLVQDVIPHMGALVQELEGALESGSPRRRHELEVRRKDGAVLPLGISISLLRGENGEKRGVVAIFQDLTEVHRMRELVRRADKMAAVGELSTAIAHEIRAPLASICGSIEMLAGELALSGDNRKLMDLVVKEADRLDRIITDFLEFARLKRPAFEPVDVEACLNEVLLLLRHSSDLSRNVSIEVKSGSPHACVYADDEQIRQVFLNLIMNAHEAMPDGGRLTMRIDTVIKALRDGGCPEECVAIDFEN